MNQLRLFALGALLAVGGSTLQAQTPNRAAPPPPAGNGEVHGVVQSDAAKTPVVRAAVAVHSATDSSLVAGEYADNAGSFRVRGLRPGAYYLRVTSMGFKPQRQAFTITPVAPSVDAGIIGLAQIATVLQSVEVTAERAAVVVEPDRNSYTAKQVAPGAGNASEILDAVPSVQVDGEGKVSLRGNENVAIQINGRPSPIRGAQLGAYLKSVPSNIVDRIEVVPNPSARYDPEGMAGIINIVLKQNVDLGISAGLNLQAAETDRFNASGNAGYQAGKLTLFSSLGVYSDDRAIVGINDRERYDALRSLEGITAQDIDGRTGGKGQNFSANADYKLSPRDLFSNALTVNNRTGADNQVSSFIELDGSRNPYDFYERPRNADTKGLMFDYTTALKRTFEPRKHELSTEVRFNNAHDEDRTELWKDPSSGARLEGELDATDAITRQLTAQADYTRPLGKAFKLETGYKGNGRWLDRDFSASKDATGSGTWVPSNLSNSFQFDETVHAAYGVLSQTIGKMQLQGGLRAERASRTFSLASPAEEYPYDYTSLFPSGVVMYSPSEATQLKANAEKLF